MSKIEKLKERQKQQQKYLNAQLEELKYKNAKFCLIIFNRMLRNNTAILHWTTGDYDKIEFGDKILIEYNEKVRLYNDFMEPVEYSVAFDEGWTNLEELIFVLPMLQ